MKSVDKLFCGMALLAAGGLLAGTAAADPIPAGWACVGSCGTGGADGVVTAAPTGAGTYQWVSTSGGITGAGIPDDPRLSSVTRAQSTNGSALSTFTFSAGAGDALNLYFNFVSSDNQLHGNDYGWAGLFAASGDFMGYLFKANAPSSVGAQMVPGIFPSSPVIATLSPTTSGTAGTATWSPLGSSSGTCAPLFGTTTLCGRTNWVQSSYTFGAAGDYFIELGASNYRSTAFDSGLAMAGFNFAPAQSDVPEPASLGVFGFGALLIGGVVVLRRRRTV